MATRKQLSKIKFDFMRKALKTGRVSYETMKKYNDMNLKAKGIEPSPSASEESEESEDSDDPDDEGNKGNAVLRMLRDGDYLDDDELGDDNSDLALGKLLIRYIRAPAPHPIDEDSAREHLRRSWDGVLMGRKFAISARPLHSMAHLEYKPLWQALKILKMPGIGKCEDFCQQFDGKKDRWEFRDFWEDYLQHLEAKAEKKGKLSGWDEQKVLKDSKWLHQIRSEERPWDTRTWYQWMDENVQTTRDKLAENEDSEDAKENEQMSHEEKNYTEEKGNEEGKDEESKNKESKDADGKNDHGKKKEDEEKSIGGLDGAMDMNKDSNPGKQQAEKDGSDDAKDSKNVHDATVPEANDGDDKEDITAADKITDEVYDFRSGPEQVYPFLIWRKRKITQDDISAQTSQKKSRSSSSKSPEDDDNIYKNSPTEGFPPTTPKDKRDSGYASAPEPRMTPKQASTRLMKQAISDSANKLFLTGTDALGKKKSVVEAGAALTGVEEKDETEEEEGEDGDDASTAKWSCDTCERDEKTGKRIWADTDEEEDQKWAKEVEEEDEDEDDEEEEDSQAGSDEEEEEEEDEDEDEDDEDEDEDQQDEEEDEEEDPTSPPAPAEKAVTFDRLAKYGFRQLMMWEYPRGRKHRSMSWWHFEEEEDLE
ncbi:MAG: hypothetical protein Q9212_005199, partial [Teloschistes hypoglaucus]